jgi:hypothetical protein
MAWWAFSFGVQIVSAGIRVRTGIRAPARIDSPGVGSDADQRRRLDHARDAHGLRPFTCPPCGGDGCARCSGHGVLFDARDMTPCGPDCLLQEAPPT